MFTGIVECIGVLQSITANGKGAVIEVNAKNMDFSDVAIGDSIACSGVCVTVVSMHGSSFTANISHETMACTIFKNLKKGSLLNLEKALTPNKHMGGHIVSGHVDGVGIINSITKSDDVMDIWISAPQDISRYIAHKGSITVDGISLTVNEVNDNDFRLTLIPHTHSVTTADNWVKGQSVNLEIDVLARYLERLLQCGAVSNQTLNDVGLSSNTSKSNKNKLNSTKSSLSMDTLMENGFF